MLRVASAAVSGSLRKSFKEPFSGFAGVIDDGASASAPRFESFRGFATVFRENDDDGTSIPAFGCESSSEFVIVSGGDDDVTSTSAFNFEPLKEFSFCSGGDADDAPSSASSIRVIEIPRVFSSVAVISLNFLSSRIGSFFATFATLLIRSGWSKLLGSNNSSPFLFDTTLVFNTVPV